MRPVRGVLGEVTRRHDGEDRSGAVRAGGAAGSPTRSKVNDGETKCSSMLRAERQWNMGNEMQDSRKNTNEFILAKTLTQATQKSTARPNRELRDQAERRKTTTEHGPC